MGFKSNFIFNEVLKLEDLAKSVVSPLSRYAFGDLRPYYNKIYITNSLSSFLLSNVSSLARTNDGAYTWGNNDNSQLGIGTYQNVSFPTYMGVYTRGSIGTNFAVYLKEDGSAWASGDNSYGQLGINSTSQATTPTSVTGSRSFNQIVCGTDFVLGVINQTGFNWGTCYSWGNNTSGQLGNNTLTSKSSPISVLGNVNQISAGLLHSFAVDTNGVVWGWGNNAYGQLGLGDNSNRSAPTIVLAKSHSIIQIACGALHTMALMIDGTVWSWGRNNNGQLASGDTIDKNREFKIIGPHEYQQIACGGYHSLGLKYDGSLWGWGSNNLGQLGNNSTAVAVTSPVSVIGNYKFTHIYCGAYTSYAIREDGVVMAWGRNLEGQIGIETTDNKSSPVSIGTKRAPGVYLTNLTASKSLGATFSPEVLEYICPDQTGIINVTPSCDDPDAKIIITLARLYPSGVYVSDLELTSGETSPDFYGSVSDSRHLLSDLVRIAVRKAGCEQITYYIKVISV